MFQYFSSEQEGSCSSTAVVRGVWLCSSKANMYPAQYDICYDHSQKYGKRALSNSEQVDLLACGWYVVGKGGRYVVGTWSVKVVSREVCL